MTRADVSVVIPVRDDLERLERCLDALERQTLPAHRREVVVVDDGSRVPLEAVGRRPGVVLVSQANAGSYAARNAGVAASSGKVVAFTDADCLPREDWLERGLVALDSADVVAGVIEVFPRGGRPGAIELFDAVTAFPQEHFVRRWGFGATANLLTTRATLEAVGPFDARLRSGGDAEWGERATATGCTTVFAPDVVVRHPARARLGELLEKSSRTARGVEQLGRLRDDVTPLPEAVRRHLWSPVERAREARLAGVAGADLARFVAVAAVAAVIGAGEVVRGRVSGAAGGGSR